MRPCSKNLLVLAIFLSTWLVHAQQGTNSGSIVVDSFSGTISTRVGCYQEIQCTGIGTSIGWRSFGMRVGFLTNSTSFLVLMETEPVDGHPPSVLQWRSFLVFPNITTEEANAYSCSIYYETSGVNRAPQLITVQLEVSPEVISIEPPIGDKNLSSYYVGDSLLIGCPVQTCAGGVVVQFFFNDTIIAMGMPSSTDEQVYTANLIVTMDTPGTYTCRVTGDAPGGVASQSFNITGTPMIRPTMQTDVMPVETDPTRNPVDPTQMTTTGHGVQLGPTLSLLCLLALAAWLCVYRL